MQQHVQERDNHQAERAVAVKRERMANPEEDAVIMVKKEREDNGDMPRQHPEHLLLQ